MLPPSPWTTVQNHPARRMGGCREQKAAPQAAPSTTVRCVWEPPQSQPPAECSSQGCPGASGRGQTREDTTDPCCRSHQFWGGVVSYTSVGARDTPHFLTVEFLGILVPVPARSLQGGRAPSVSAGNLVRVWIHTESELGRTTCSKQPRKPARKPTNLPDAMARITNSP